MNKKTVVIIGGGFGGLNSAKAFKNTDFEVIVVDKTNHHLFQPLLYQVATAALSPGDIAVPIRSVFSGQQNITVVLGEVKSVDKVKNQIELADRKISFDYLILSPGASHSYFGNDEWEKYAPGLKTLNDALSIREGILCSFEKAELLEEEKQKRKYLSFVIIGGGPTGVEMAGAIAEISKKTMLKDFRNIDPSLTKIILIEAAPHILGAYPEKLSQKAKSDLENMGVTVLTDTKVVGVEGGGVRTEKDFFETNNLIWAAGNNASALLKSLDEKLDKAGRVIVENDLSIHGNENIFVIGDAALAKNKSGEPLPGIAPVAIQQGKYVADVIKSNMAREYRKPFAYLDKGSMATIGKAKAIAKIRNLEFSGLFAWLLWSFVHIFFLIGFRNRFRVMAEWIWYYFSSRRGVRLITKRPKCRPAEEMKN